MKRTVSFEKLCSDNQMPIEMYQAFHNTVLHSEFLGNFILGNIEYLPEVYSRINSDRGFDVLYEELLSMSLLECEENIFMEKLRIFKMKEYLLIAARDLTFQYPVDKIVKHISDFAKCVIQISYVYAYHNLTDKYGIPKDENGDTAKFSIIGLGKLGGSELNFSSDIDIMYVYSSEKGEAVFSNGDRGISNHEFFTKLGEKIKFLISERTSIGIVYRVDLRLRPDGDKGEIALPLRSYEIYYESYGQSWERMMLLKADVVGGDTDLGEYFIESVRPFVFRRSIDYKLIEDLLEVKEKINSRIRLKGNIKNVKLGFGGIREIEFIVQALQILNYPKNKKIYNRNTLISLALLKEEGLLKSEEADILERSYRFLRRLEHMAQVERELQTHTVPETSETFDMYLLRAGFSSNSEFQQKYMEVTNKVNWIFKSILKEDSKSVSINLFDEELEIKDIAEYLKSKKIEEPEKCAEILRRIVFGKKSRIRSASEKKILQQLLDIVINDLPQISDCVDTLHYLEKFFLIETSVFLFYEIFMEMPQILKKMTNIFSLSPYLSGLVVGNRNILDYIYDPKPVACKKAEVIKSFYDVLEDTGDNEEYEFNLIRKKHQEMMFNAGYAYLNKEANVVNFARSLSELAKGTVQFAFEREYTKLAGRYGLPRLNSDAGGEECGYLIVGLGKLGSSEMSFGSDLDIIVLYEGEGNCDGENGVTNREFFARLVQKVISYLSTPTVYGYLYKIDMRLRPSGSKGALVTTLNSFEDYHKNKAMVWEKQALIRAEVVNDNPSMSEIFYHIKHNALFEKIASAEEIREIYDMRFRIEKEKGSPKEINDIKAGFGGLIDIEFTVQMLQLLYGKQQPEIRITNTHDALHVLKESGALKGRDFYILHNSYLYFRNIENLIRAFKNSPSSKIPKDTTTLSKLGKFFGYDKNGSEKLISEYVSMRNSVRGSFNRIFEGKF